MVERAIDKPGIPISQLGTAVRDAIPSVPGLPGVEEDDFYQRVCLGMLNAGYDTVSATLIRVVGYRLRTQILRDTKIHQKKVTTCSLEDFTETHRDIIDEMHPVEKQVFSEALYQDILRVLGPERGNTFLRRFAGEPLGVLAKEAGIDDSSMTRRLQKTAKELAENPEFRNTWEHGICE